MAALEPSSKKRKLDVAQKNQLAKQESFTEVLRQLEAEEDASGGETPSHTPTCVLMFASRLYRDISSMASTTCTGHGPRT